MRKKFFTGIVVFCAVALPAALKGDSMKKQMLKDYWDLDRGKLTFHSRNLDAEAQLPRGWISLKVGGAEFLKTGPDYGGLIFRRKDTWITDWTNLSNLSHDQLLGRNGSISNGLYLLKIITGWTLPRFEIYAGFNLKEDHDMVMFLSDDIELVRLTHPTRGGRYGARRNIDRQTKGKPINSRGCIIIHKTGKALGIEDTVQVGNIKAPDGSTQLAVTFKCKGLAANTFHFITEPNARAENFLMFPRVSVKAENQQRGGGPWAIYGPGKPPEISVDFGWLKPEVFDGFVELDVRHSLGKQHVFVRHQVTKNDRDEKGKYKVTFRPKFTMPGVSEVYLRIVSKDGEMMWLDRYRMLFDWTNYKPVYSAQPDMKAFWNKTLKELREIPLEPEVKRVFPNTKDWELYEVSYNTWGKKRCWALMYVPKNAKKPLPAIVTAHPGNTGWRVNKGPDGVYGSKIKADPRFVTIIPLIRGHKPDQKDIPFNQPWWGPLDNKEDYAARTWYSSMVRAIDYLATRPDLVDMKRIVATGGSQGGNLALATAALDPRVAVCLSDSPSNCMLHEIIDPEKYSSFGPTIGQVPKGQTVEDLVKTLSYFDPANMAPWIKCPTYIGVTVGDLTVHSMGGLSVFHNLKGLKSDQKGFYPGVNTTFHANSKDGRKKFAEIKDKIAERR